MDSERLKMLLKKYWNCETSLQEEREIKGYFATEDSPASLTEIAALFRYYDLENKKELSGSSFDKEILELLQNESAGIKKTKQITMQPWLISLGKIAAALIIVLSVVFIVQQRTSNKNSMDNMAIAFEKDTFDDPEQAYKETMEALMLISKHLNEGKKQTMKIAVFSEAQQTIEESVIN